MQCDPDRISCQLDGIRRALEAPGLLEWLTLAGTLFTALVSVFVGLAALRVSQRATGIAEEAHRENSDRARREERHQFAEMVSDFVGRWTTGGMTGRGPDKDDVYRAASALDPPVPEIVDWARAEVNRALKIGTTALRETSQDRGSRRDALQLVGTTTETRLRAWVQGDPFDTTPCSFEPKDT